MGLTATGFEVPSLDDILLDLQTALGAKPGWSGVDTGKTSLVGQYLRAVAEQVHEVYSLVGQVYASLDLESATGTALDRLAAIAGMSKKSGESDSALRARVIELAAGAGAGSVSAISARLRQLDAMTDTAVAHNYRDYTDPVTGLPPHCMKIVGYPDVSGDSDALAAWQAAIWGAVGVPAGVTMLGSESSMYYDAEHEIEAEIRWSWASEVQIYTAVTATVDDAFPATGQDQVKQIVADTVNALHIGTDVLPDLIEGRIIDGVPGIRTVDVECGRSSGLTSPDPLSIGLTEVAKQQIGNVTLL